eukprot:gene5815-6513_t
MASLISSYSDIFAANPKKRNLVNIMQHRIITNESQPVNRKPYRIPHAWHRETDEQITEMLQTEIIRLLITMECPCHTCKKRTDPCAEEDKEKTAFSMPRRKFEFNVTPF